ncbi:MAG: glycosyltransferase family 39 protein [Flavobacteriales bacterium]|nr:glycosyltransferase family 39 protein [Flavobacteriales bacterium]MBK9060740.1 glycosyltransferase family 39 protein [Flavobacteriales bacterium]QQS72238.1 MAG: glycosyltransferase family 39 protein [Flavobacteriales bacterium]HQV40352.1 glycosyltransferase family 39 protein [Flavobacteriales bacterium]HQW31529.1 glycosyltransferase family 39 protein [Flavobacteriales bacterium]
MRSLSKLQVQLLIALVAALLFIPGLGAVHLFDWDEINFAEIAREMLATHNWLQPQIGYVPFYEKPPLFMWMQAVSMSAFGVNEFAARFPDAICGIVTLLVLFRIGDRMRGRLFGLLWVLAYVGSILPHLYFRSGIIDPWFNLFIFLGFLAFIRMSDTPASADVSNREKNIASVLAGVWLGLAVLTKGPVGILIPALCALVYWVMNRFKLYVSIPRVLLMFAMLLIVPGLWFGADLLHNGPTFITAFFWRQVAMLSSEDAGHGGFFGYHFVILLIGCFPASVFALQEMLKSAKRSENGRQAPDNRQLPMNIGTTDNYRKWMLILFWVVLILFTIVKTKIVHYSSLCYFPLTFLAALQLERLWNGGKATQWSRLLMGAIGTLFAVVTLVLPYLGMHPELIAPLLKNDAFAQGNLMANVHWTGWEALAGVWMVVILYLGHRFFSKAQYRSGIVTVFGGTALFVTITLYYFINRIEGYSQRAAVEFFQQRQGEKCYVLTKNYKSYAQWFYSDMPPITDPRAYDEEWLLHGAVDRPVYVVCKVTSAEEVAAIPGLKEIGRKNGFVFWKREVQ